MEELARLKEQGIAEEIDLEEKYDNVKTERAYTAIRKYGWLLSILIGVGGQFYPYLGLLVVPIMLSLIVMSAFKGLYWCGNFCPHGSYYDVPLLKISPNENIPDLLKTRVAGILVFAFFIMNFSSNIFSALQVEPGTRLAQVGGVMANVYLVVLAAATLLGIAVNSRAWCWICPMRTLQLAVYQLGRKLNLTAGSDQTVIITRAEDCRECALCSQVCPIELKPYPILRYKQENNYLEEPNCMRCRVCIENCPVNILKLEKPGKSD